MVQMYTDHGATVHRSWCSGAPIYNYPIESRRLISRLELYLYKIGKDSRDIQAVQMTDRWKAWKSNHTISTLPTVLANPKTGFAHSHSHGGFTFYKPPIQSETLVSLLLLLTTCRLLWLLEIVPFCLTKLCIDMCFRMCELMKIRQHVCM
jgi:hypothetical protein